MYTLGIGGILSAVLFVGVGMAYWKKKQQLIGPNTDHLMIARKHKLQKRLTKKSIIKVVFVEQLC